MIFVGPIDEHEQGRLLHTLRVRDVLIAQDMFDHRSMSSYGSDERAGGAAFYAISSNECVLKRYRMSPVELVMASDRYARMTKREFTKHLYREWSALGINVRRGKTFPSLRIAGQSLRTFFSMLASYRHQME